MRSPKARRPLFPLPFPARGAFSWRGKSAAQQAEADPPRLAKGPSHDTASPQRLPMAHDQRLLAVMGEALYGPHWQAALADALGVSRRAIRRWQAEGDIPNGVWAELHALRHIPQRPSAASAAARSSRMRMTVWRVTRCHGQLRTPWPPCSALPPVSLRLSHKKRIRTVPYALLTFFRKFFAGRVY
jgi:hypothetical protein